MALGDFDPSTIVLWQRDKTSQMSANVPSGTTTTPICPHRLESEVVYFLAEDIVHECPAIGCDTNKFLPLCPCHVLQLACVLPLQGYTCV